ncbi:triose-phosphate isomerase [Pseudaestuariivita sp.]|uniref:triose-phosphate isomerase n=1 Tax=Pseudaestuariivita sp. TaxID=2211669 RepID=UPI00405A1D3A
MRRKIAAGNWKMNGLTASLTELDTLAARFPKPGCDVLICPPATLIAPAKARAGSIAIGGQDCHTGVSGAHTGDVSAEMLADIGASHVIVGHSERRDDHGESSELIEAKAEAAWRAGLTAVICIGESLAQREAGETLDVLTEQLAQSTPDGATAANTVIAYEPVWAIGTGKVPTLAQIGEVHDALRGQLEARFGAEGTGIRLLYGGSVKPSNAAEIFAVSNVDGALVGGASLKADDFGGIISALEAA